GLVVGGVAAALLSRPMAVNQPLGRFALALEPVTLGSGFAQQVALSPDGSLLALVGRGPSGGQIYLRAMSDSIPLPVPGADEAYSPFFSADGKRLGFWIRPSRLQWVPLEGGSPTTLSDSAGPFAVWTDRGEVVHVDQVGHALRLVGTNGTEREL